MTSFIDYGFDANDRIRKNNEEMAKERERKRNLPRRFWLSKGESAQIILLDDTPACVWEYDVKVDGRFGNFFTCPKKETGKHSILDSYKDQVQFNRHYIGFLTIIDCTEYTDKNGKKRFNTKKVLPITSQALDRFKQYKKNRGTLVGAKFIVSRSNAEKAERIGDTWDFIEKVDLSTILDSDGKPVDTTPANYEELLKIRPESEVISVIEKVIGKPVTAQSIGSYEEAPAVATSESEVPF